MGYFNDPRTIAIAAQNANSAAAEVYASIFPGIPFNPSEFDAIRESIFEGTLSLAEAAIAREEAIQAEATAEAQRLLEEHLAAQPVEPFGGPAQGHTGSLHQPAPYQPQGYPPAGYPPPAQPAPGAPYANRADMFVQCPKCGGATYDNRADNNRRRQTGYKLGPEHKCKNRDCGGAIWPADFEQHRNKPSEPRR